MNADGTRRYDETMRKFLAGHLTRAQLLKAAGVGAALVAVPGAAMADSVGNPGTGSAPPAFPALSFYPDPRLAKSGSYAPENVADILNIAQTAEYFAVTFLTAALNNAAAIGLTGLQLNIVQAILSAEIAHVQFLTAVGANPLTTTFTVPDPKALSDYTTFFKNVEAADTIFVGAYLAAIREFSELGQPQLSKIAAQFMGVEAEHRALARAALALKGDAASIPPNNKKYETDLFLYVREAAALLVALGFVGGTGTPAAFPGLDAATKATGGIAMIQSAPNSAAEGSTTTTNITAEHT